MNKMYCFLLLVLSSATHAQIQKQSILLGGHVYYYDDKYLIDKKNIDAEFASFGISIGTAIKENTVIGINFSYSPAKYIYFTGFDTADVSYKRYNIGAFFRKYKNLGKDFYFFAQAEGAFIIASQSDNYRIATGDIKATQKGGFLTISPGISYEIFKKIQLEISIPSILRIEYVKTKVESALPQVKNSERKQIFFNSSLHDNPSGWLSVGFRFVL